MEMLLQLQDHDRLFESEKRRRIYDLIRARPGVHPRRIERELGLSMGTIEYHLRRLSRSGVVITREYDRFKSYFAKGDIDRRDMDHLYYLRRRTPRRIARELNRRPGIQLKELVERMPLAASTVSFHLRRMVRGRVILEHTRGREKFYRLTDPERVDRLLQQFNHTFDRPPTTQTAAEIGLELRPLFQDFQPESQPDNPT